jgi:hypothetical protein
VIKPVRKSGIGTLRLRYQVVTARETFENAFGANENLTIMLCTT